MEDGGAILIQENAIGRLTIIQMHVPGVRSHNGNIV